MSEPSFGARQRHTMDTCHGKATCERSWSTLAEGQLPGGVRLHLHVHLLASSATSNLEPTRVGEFLAADNVKWLTWPQLHYFAAILPSCIFHLHCFALSRIQRTGGDLRWHIAPSTAEGTGREKTVDASPTIPPRSYQCAT